MLEGGARMQIELQARSRKWKSRSVDVGFFEQETATIASINEYGAPAGPKNGRIPTRPFMRTTVALQKNHWVENIAKMLELGASSKQALNSTGKVMVVDFRIVLQSGVWTRNAERTIKLKGFDYPLYQTGKLLAPAIKRRVS